jgi:hypothetical protein
MKCNIILDDLSRSGIIPKMASRLCEALRGLGANCLVSNRHSHDVDVNHFMMFYYAEGEVSTKNTMFITHVDDPLKLQIVKEKLEFVDVGICMSRMTVKSLVDLRVPRESLCYATPPHDGLVKPRRIRIGITTHLYEDGRKREALLSRLAREVDLVDFHFEIFGLGWEKVSEQLRAGGATVLVHAGTGEYQADYIELCRRVPEFDYYLYMGLDEGSLGTLDALAAGVPTIITEQGFHLDLPGGITYPVMEYAEMRSVFTKIADERRGRMNAVVELTWSNYARKHLEIWQALIDGQKAQLPQILGQHGLQQENLPQCHHYRTQMSGFVGYSLFRNRLRRNMLKAHYLTKLKRRARNVLKKLLPGYSAGKP